MNIKLVAVLATMGTLLACGDSGSGTGGKAAGGGDTGGAAAGGAAAGGEASGGSPGAGGAVPLTCDTGCQALFDCGLEGNPPLCVYAAADSGAFVPGCVDQCGGMMSLLTLIDPDDCPKTISTLSSLSADFKDVCENGIGSGGAGGGT